MPVDGVPSDMTTESPADAFSSEPDRSVSSDDGSFSEQSRPREYGGRKGPDPVRYGDWEKNGRCIDF